MAAAAIAIRPEPAVAEGGVRPWPQSIREFEQLVEAFQHRLVQFAYCRLQSREDAEDVVQDVLLQAYRDREKHRGIDNAGPYLYRMVANRCTDLVRRRGLASRKLEPEVAPGTPHELVEAAAQQRWIDSLLQRLPSEQAEVIRLRIYGELPFDAVARAAGCPLATVKSRFRLGLQKLRPAFLSQGGSR